MEGVSGRILELNDGVVGVKLIAATAGADPISLASHAALYCYQGNPPELGKDLIDVKSRLFDVGHHTTFEHFYFTFAVEGLSVGDITFGLHLMHPFYNSDQRSGRFCASMFANPDFSALEKYVKKYWPELSQDKLVEIMEYIKNSISIYQKHLGDAEKVAGEFILKERPHASKSVKESNTKIAQEQMRMFIPIIFPTGFDYTIDLITLVSLWETAWTPVMRSITDMMMNLVLVKFPELTYMFKLERRRAEDWSPKFNDFSGVLDKPRSKVISLIGDSFVEPKLSDMHPVDKLHFDPEYMENLVTGFLQQVEISCATMGQDQRHRTVHRGKPEFTGKIYMPPLLKKLVLDFELEHVMNEWIKVSEGIPPTLKTILAPYGAMVKYKKLGELSAVIHELCKRLCWCAQEEIYHLCLALIRELKTLGREDIVALFEPPCFKTGVCGEGKRCCGRDISLRKDRDQFFVERIV